MSSERDDEALAWAGDDDLSEATPVRASRVSNETTEAVGSPRKLAAGWRIVGRPGRFDAEADPSPNDAADAPVVPAQISSTMLIALGVLGGMYLLYSVGWLIALQKSTYVPNGIVNQFMYQLGLWLAVAAGPLWFAATLWITRGRGWWCIISLVIGALVLVPLPFIMGS